MLLFSLDGFKLRIESRYLLVQRGDLGVGRVQRALYFHQRALIGGLLRQAFDLLGKRVLGGGDFLQADFQRRDFVGGFLELCQLGCGVRLSGGAGDLLGGDLGIQIVQLGFLVGQLVFCLGEQNLRFRQRLFQLLHLDGGFAVIAQRLGVGGLGGGKIAVGYVQLILQAGDIKLQGSDAFFQGGYLGLQFALIADGQGQVVQQRIGIGLGLGKFGLQGGDIGVGGVQIGLQRVGGSLGGVQLALQGGILAGGLLTGLGQRLDIGLGGVQIGLQRLGGRLGGVQFTLQRGIQIGSFLAGLGQRVDIGLGGVQLALQGGILAGGLLTGLGQRLDIGLGGVQIGLQRLGGCLGGIQLALQRGVLSGSFLAGLGQRVDIGLGGIQIGLQLRGGLGRVGKLGGQVVFILLEAGIEAQQPNDNG